MTSPDRVFISHAATDKPYAQALARALDVLADGALDIRYSTSSEAGPQGGTQWRDWINEQVVEATTALVVVTPASLAKPWLMWEAGACRGVALGEPQGAPSRMLVTVAYGLMEAECPDPLRGDQIVVGTDRTRVRKLLTGVLSHHGLDSIEAGERLGGALDVYTDEVRASLMQSASLPTEGNIREWISRLDELVQAKRLAELDDFSRWMDLAFGRSEEAGTVPIDVRLHRRLGELHLGARNYDSAVRELKLARLAAPRDIYILRPLGEAYLKRFLETPGEDPEAERATIEQLLGMIEEIDSDAFDDSPDVVALQSKFYRRAMGDLTKAASVLASGLERNPDSYYLADLLGQTLLQADRHEEARAAFRRIPAILERTGDNSLWASASHATALVVVGELAPARSKLAEILASNATKSQLASVALGIKEVARRLGLDDERTSDLVAGFP